MQAIQHTRQQRARGIGRLVTKSLGGRTRIAELFQEGAAKIRLPESFTDELEAVTINTAGGITGRRRIRLAFSRRPGCFVTATTQACEKIYKASMAPARSPAESRSGKAPNFTGCRRKAFSSTMPR